MTDGEPVGPTPATNWAVGELGGVAELVGRPGSRCRARRSRTPTDRPSGSVTRVRWNWSSKREPRDAGQGVLGLHDQAAVVEEDRAAAGRVADRDGPRRVEEEIDPLGVAGQGGARQPAGGVVREGAGDAARALGSTSGRARGRRRCRCCRCSCTVRPSGCSHGQQVLVGGVVGVAASSRPPSR